MSVPQIKLRRFSRSNVDEPDEDPNVIEPQSSMAVEVGDSGDDDYSDEEDDFLADLKNDRFKPKPEEPKPKKATKKKQEAPIQPPQPPQDDGLLSEILGFDKPKPPKKTNTKKLKNSDEFGDLFDSTPTPILGKDKRTLLTRVKQYKTLFPDELKSFKVKANATTEDLQEALDEMDTIVQCQGVQGLINESFFSAVGVVEGISARYEMLDISGTSQLLRQNPEVGKLLRILAIKYGVFSQCPPEGQLLLLTCSTMMMCRQNNLKRGRVRDILNNTEI